MDFIDEKKYKIGRILIFRIQDSDLAFKRREL